MRDKKYQPTPEEIARAEEMMTPVQREVSALREQKLKELSDGEKEIFDPQRLEKANSQAVRKLIEEARSCRERVRDIWEKMWEIKRSRGYRDEWYAVEATLDSLSLSPQRMREFYLNMFGEAFSNLEAERKNEWMDSNYFGLIWQDVARQALRKLNVPRSVQDYVGQKIDEATQAGEKVRAEKRK